jgi:hypothetical protein
LPIAEEARITGAPPAFATQLLALTTEQRKEILSAQHPDYTVNQPSWLVLLDAFEGRGGFLNGHYLWAYPRETQASFDERQRWARYHNYLEALVDLYVKYIFTQGVKRTSTSAEFDAWTENVDGAGTSLTEFLKQFAAMALVCGHAGVLVDKTDDEPTGVTKADERAQVIATIFSAPSILDWRYTNNKLSGVKLSEAAPATSLLEPMKVGEAPRTQYLLWDQTGWARFDGEGEFISGDTPDLDMVPLITLRPKASQTSRMLGRALVSNANVVKAVYNRGSEEDEVLRSQAFSVLTVEIDKDGDVEQTKASLGSVIGTAKALVAKGQIKYATPDQTVPATIRENIAYLVQEMYRGAHVRFNRDSLAAQSGESIRLQYTELNEMLQGFARSLAQAENEIARAWFGWTEATPEAAQAAFKESKFTAEYPDEFFLDELTADLEAWAEAIRMDLGETMTKRIKKRAVRRIEPDIPEDELKKIDDEIENQDEERLLPPPSNPLDTGNLNPELGGGGGLNG